MGWVLPDELIHKVGHAHTVICHQMKCVRRPLVPPDTSRNSKSKSRGEATVSTGPCCCFSPFSLPACAWVVLGIRSWGRGKKSLATGVPVQCSDTVLGLDSNRTTALFEPFLQKGREKPSRWQNLEQWSVSLKVLASQENDSQGVTSAKKKSFNKHRDGTSDLCMLGAISTYSINIQQNHEARMKIMYGLVAWTIFCKAILAMVR